MIKKYSKSMLPRDLHFFFPILSDVGYFKGDGIPSYVTRPTGVFSCNCTTPSVHVLKSTHGNGNIYFFNILITQCN